MELRSASTSTLRTLSGERAPPSATVKMSPALTAHEAPLPPPMSAFDEELPAPAAPQGRAETRAKQWNIVRARMRAVGAMAATRTLGNASKTLQEELEEFVLNESAPSIVFPAYLSDRERLEVRRLARGLGLRSDQGDLGELRVWRAGDTPTALDPVVDATDVARLGRELLGQSLTPRPVLPRRLTSAPAALPQTGAQQQQQQQQQQLPPAPPGAPSLKRVQSVSAAVLMEAAAAAAAESPTPLAEGDGGVYAISGAGGKRVAVLKPMTEERFERAGLMAGEGALRELAAYRLDRAMGHFSRVPPTTLAAMRVTDGQPQSSGAGDTAAVRRGAVQQFCESAGSMEDRGMPHDLAAAAAFVSVEAVQRVAVLDVRLFNTDRHPGNVLLVDNDAAGAAGCAAASSSSSGPHGLVPIDHGCVLPSWYALSEARLDWAQWPQAREPLLPAVLEHVRALDAERDAALLRGLGVREECVTTLRVCTRLLQRAAEAGLSPYEMACMLQRAGCFENPSPLELLLHKAAQASGVPFSFAANEYGEQVGRVAKGAVSRRPPFFDALEAELELVGACADCGVRYLGSEEVHRCADSF